MIFGDSRSRRSRTPPRAGRRAARESIIGDELPPKLIPSLRHLFSTAAGLVHTRLTLAGIELEEEIQRLLKATVFALIVLLLVLLALIVGTFTIVVAVPAEYRVATMIAITVIYLVVAAGLAMRLRSIFKLRPPIFGATLAELEKDKETWSHMAHAHRAADEATTRNAHRQEDAFAQVQSANASERAEGARS